MRDTLLQEAELWGIDCQKTYHPKDLLPILDLGKLEQVYSLLKTGQLRGVKINGIWRIKGRYILEFIVAHSNQR